MEGLSVDEFIKSPSENILFRFYISNLKNVFLYSGACSMIFWMFPRAQQESLHMESLVAMNLWRIPKVPYWMATAVIPGAIMSGFAKFLWPLLTSTDAEAAAATNNNVVRKAVSWVFRCLGGKRTATTPKNVSWAHLLVVYLTWIPAMTYYRWFSWSPTLRSFFYFRRSTTLEEINVILPPRTLCALDVCSILSERICTFFRGYVVPTVLKQPVVATRHNFVKQGTCQVLAAVFSYVLISRSEKLPDIRVPWFGGSTLTTISLDRHVAIIQSLLEVCSEYLFDYVLTTWIPVFRAPPPVEPFAPSRALSADEEVLLEKVVRLYGVQGRHRPAVEQVVAATFANCAVDASRKVAFATVMWAAMVVEAREEQQPPKNSLAQYKDQLRRVNHDIDDALVKQESTMIMQNSTFVAGGLESSSSIALDVCAVCLSKLRPDQDTVEVTHCHHVFHSECLSAWLAKGTQCPCCRFDIAQGKEATEAEAVPQPEEIERVLLQRIDELGFNIPHLYDYEEWSAVRKYCCEHNISCNTALSVIPDSTPTITTTYLDFAVAPLLFMLDGYNQAITFVRSEYLDFS